MYNVPNTTIIIAKVEDRDDDYYQFLKLLKEKVKSEVTKDTKLFHTDAVGLFDCFLNYLPGDAKQHYTCNCCRQFFDHFGDLVTVSPEGKIKSFVWDTAGMPEFFVTAVERLRVYVEGMKITGMFIASKDVLGSPVTGPWKHVSVTIPRALVNSSRLLNAGQVMAEKLEDFKMLMTATRYYKLADLETAVKLLESDSLYGSAACLGVGKWFLQVMSERSLAPKDVKDNLLWVRVATAPTGFTHIKSTVIGSLLDDLAAGLDFSSVSAKFKDKMNPLAYQRKQNPASAGHIRAGEDVVKKIGCEKSLERRFAKIEDITTTLWTPGNEVSEATETKGVFGHLVPKTAPVKADLKIPGKKITWEKFRDTVLGDAIKIEYLVKPVNDNYFALVTAEDEKAPPIVQWDSEDDRNPLTWYVYPGTASSAKQWLLKPGFAKVNAITLQPSMWKSGFEHQGKGVMFVLDGAKDSGYKSIGNALFPATLISELKTISRTIETFAAKAVLSGYDSADACGVRLQGGCTWDATVKVTTKVGEAIYILDRWD